MSKSVGDDKKYQSIQVLIIAGGHFVHDTYTAFVAPLLPLIIERLSLSLTLVGSLTLFLQLPSLLNPLIGYLDDRIGLRKFVAFTPAVTGTLMSCMGLASGYWSLVLLFFATGFSIAFFHSPAPAMVARVSGDRVGKGMSFFMAAGELGRTLGPLIAVGAVSVWTFDGIWKVSILGWIASLILYFRVCQISVEKYERPPWQAVYSVAWRLFLPLLLIVFARGFLVSSMGLYLPTFLRGQGASLWFAAGSLSAFELAGVAGALSSGTLSDRWGRKLVLSAAMISSALLMLAFVNANDWLQIPILMTLGMASLSAQPVMLAIVQDILPSHRALANGIHLAMSFISRPIAAIIIGVIGDYFGLRTAIVWSAVIVFLVVPVILFLPKPQQ